MTFKTIKTLRARAFHAQAGHCYYCDRPMWLRDPDELGLRPKAARFDQADGPAALRLYRASFVDLV